MLLLLLKGATSQVAGSPGVLNRTVIVLGRTVIVLDRTIIVLDRSVIAIYGIFSLNFLRLGGGSDRLWLLRTTRHTSTPALPTLFCLSDDRYVYKTLPRAGLFPGARSCAINTAGTGDVCSSKQLMATWLNLSDTVTGVWGSLNLKFKS